MSKLLLAILLVASVGSCRNSIAQQVTPAHPAYDAVVIKLNKGLSSDTSVNMDESTFQATNVTLKHLLVNAYGIRERLIFGLPGWADSARYDINAKVTDIDLKTLRSLSREQRQAMLAAILMDRFHLQTHVELKTLPVYELVVAKDGPKLTASAVSPPAAGTADGLGLGNIKVNGTDMTATGVMLSDLAGNLSFPLDRTVIDRTGLTGRYDFRLQWTADNVASGAADAPPNLLTAIQEQLGLRLQAAKGPVKTLVIDRLEKPSEN